MRLLFSILSILWCTNIQAQKTTLSLSNGWQFRQVGTNNWYKATVPGSVYTDLLNNKLIPDPFFSDNEKKLRWVDIADWEYKTQFNIPTDKFAKARLQLIFEGLDTYAEVYLNDKLIISANNMFRPWGQNIGAVARPGINQLRVLFRSAKNITDSIAQAQLPLVRPDNNRLYARKAQYHFGWDWGPIFIGCGIWKNVRLEIDMPTKRHTGQPMDDAKAPMSKFVQEKDAVGERFYFTQNGQAVFCKGANWIPSEVFLPTKPATYRKQLLQAKEAGVNMIRVWGGGIYEDDLFYKLCDSLGIMVWQDFMFAGAMYPADPAFLENVHAEVKYQVQRLKKYKSVVIYCGNNEIDEAWNHWGWQGQYNLHGVDSVRIWNEYKTLFRDSIAAWVERYDGQRPYISTSPKFGWGNPRSYKEADSHYWGFWWGLADWESFYEKTGRFVSEYGMQAMPNYETVKSYTESDKRNYTSTAVQWHQKANQGFIKLNHYINRYFFDSSKIGKLSLEEYTYLSQCMQYYALKNIAAIHIAKQPINMGTLVWQWNDCWPVTSWSVTDYSRQPKAGYYALKHAYLNNDTVTEKIYPKDLVLNNPEISITPGKNNKLIVKCNEDAKYIYLYIPESYLNVSDNYFSLGKSQSREIEVKDKKLTPALLKQIKVMSLFDILSKK